MEYAPEGELFDQVVKKSEEETLMIEVTTKLRFYHICISYVYEECSRRRIFPKGVKEPEKVIMMSEVNLKPSPTGACNPKKAL